jgi:hypothetical protein
VRSFDYHRTRYSAGAQDDVNPFHPGNRRPGGGANLFGPRGCRPASALISWLDQRVRKKEFVRPDGSAVVPLRTPGGYRRFTLNDAQRHSGMLLSPRLVLDGQGQIHVSPTPYRRPPRHRRVQDPGMTTPLGCLRPSPREAFIPRSAHPESEICYVRVLSQALVSGVRRTTACAASKGPGVGLRQDIQQRHDRSCRAGGAGEPGQFRCGCRNLRWHARRGRHGPRHRWPVDDPANGEVFRRPSIGGSLHRRLYAVQLPGPAPVVELRRLRAHHLRARRWGENCSLLYGPARIR